MLQSRCTNIDCNIDKSINNSHVHVAKEKGLEVLNSQPLKKLDSFAILSCLSPPRWLFRLWSAPGDKYEHHLSGQYNKMD